jgi:hypothetical protein
MLQGERQCGVPPALEIEHRQRPHRQRPHRQRPHRQRIRHPSATPPPPLRALRPRSAEASEEIGRELGVQEQQTDDGVAHPRRAGVTGAAGTWLAMTGSEGALA